MYTYNLYDSENVYKWVFLFTSFIFLAKNHKHPEEVCDIGYACAVSHVT